VKAMLLAAGRGERLRPLTDTTPKPLLQAGHRRLIEHHLVHLADAGFTQVIINTAWLGDQIQRLLGDGSQYRLQIQYSHEGRSALETGGGIFHALPLLGEAPFLVINADIWSDYPLIRLKDRAMDSLAHLVMVQNPEHHPEGDFGIEANSLSLDSQPRYTYSGIGIYTPQFFQGCQAGAFPLAPMLREYIHQQRISGEIYSGEWMDIGTIQRLEALRDKLV